MSAGSDETAARPAAVMSGDEGRTIMAALIAEVDLHLDRCNNAPNEAVKFAEHAQALGLLRAIDIVKEHL